MVMLTRRRLLDAALALREKGELPEVLDQPSLARGTVGGDVVVAAGTAWLDAYEQVMTERYGPNRSRLQAAE